MNRQAKTQVRQLVQVHKANVFCIMETHVQFSRVEIFWRNLGYHTINFQETNPHARGMWVLYI